MKTEQTKNGYGNGNGSGNGSGDMTKEEELQLLAIRKVEGLTQGVQVAHDVLTEVGFGPHALLPDGTLAVVVLDRGWVVAGTWYQVGSKVTLKKASVVRTWGTTEGLLQLAHTGPSSSTVLDGLGEIVFLLQRGLPVFPCKKAAWPKQYK